MAETIRALVPVGTVFGPFLCDPFEAIARQLRDAISNMITGPGYCAIHGEPEDGPVYLLCFECWHVFPTAEALLADHAALVERLNAEPPPPPWDPAWYGPIVAETDPERVRVCPHCTHDL